MIRLLKNGLVNINVFVHVNYNLVYETKNCKKRVQNVLFALANTVQNKIRFVGHY